MEERPESINFITLLRGFACLIVVWSHLVGVWLNQNHVSWLPEKAVNHLLIQPLGIANYFGIFGVSIFFLISGYIITHTAQRETRTSFAVKRLFRIYPPLIVSALVILAIGGATIKTTFFNATTIDSFAPVGLPISPVTWTISVELLFYALCFVGLSLVKERPKVALAAAMAISSAALVFMSRYHGTTFFPLLNMFLYVPCLFMGATIYYYRKQRISIAWFAAFSVAFYTLAIMRFYQIGSINYGASFVYAYLIFWAALLLEPRIRIGFLSQLFANISYSLYLNHYVFGFFLLGLLVPAIGYTWAIAVTFGAVVALSYASFKWIEEPSRRFARSLLKTRRQEKERELIPA